jgi:hypothetical protein
MLVAVKACGLAILVIVTVFILHEDIVGKPWPYRLFVQVVCMVAVGGGYAYTEAAPISRPGSSASSSPASGSPHRSSRSPSCT